MLRLLSTETAVDLANAAQGGTVMDVENTDLERRVLAHEQILQVLIAHMAEAEPKFLDRLQQIFTKHHILGAGEQDYTGTAAYAEQFIQQVVRLRDKGRRSYGCYLVPARCASISLTPGITLLAGRGASAASFHPKSKYTKPLQVEEPGPS
jgi:hypothetical protein